MSELKVASCFEFEKVLSGKSNKLFYEKSEADKVIAELKSQKAQVEDDCAYWKMSEGNAVNAMRETEEYAMQLHKELRHNKYKRCLAMAYIEWLKQMTMCYYPESILYRRAYRRERKWKEMAKKFK